MNLKCLRGGWCCRCHSFVCPSNWLLLGVSLAYSSEERKRDIDVGRDAASEPAPQTPGPEPHPSQAKRGDNFTFVLAASGAYPGSPNVATPPNPTDKAGPLDSSFIWGCEGRLLQQGDWERKCITAGHLGSLLESAPRFSAFWRGEAESIEWQVKVVNVPTHTQTRTQGTFSRGKEGMEWNEASCCTQAHHLLVRGWPRRRWLNEADHECLKRPRERITVKFLLLLSSWLKYDWYSPENKSHLLEQ